MKKILIFLSLFLAVILLILFLGRNIIAKKAIVSGVNSLTGLKIEMGEIDLGVFKTTVSLKGVKLFNSADFKDALMLDLPQVYVDYDLGGFFNNKIHFKRLQLNLKELIIITEKKGNLNVAALSALKPKGGGKPPQLQIDLLELKLGKIVYKDYILGNPPSVKEIELNLDERIENINQPSQLLNLILTRAFKNRDISGLLDFNLDKTLKSNGKEAEQKVKGAAKELLKGFLLKQGQ